MNRPTVYIIRYKLTRPVEMIDYEMKIVYCHLTDDPEEGDPYEFRFDEVEFLKDNSELVERNLLDKNNSKKIIEMLYERNNEYRNEFRVLALSNGYLLTTQENTVVVEIEDDKENEALARLLYMVAESLGFLPDKYANNNLNITFDKKGSKYEDSNS